MVDVKINLIDIGSRGGFSSPWKNNSKHINYLLRCDPRNDENVINESFSTYSYAISHIEGISDLYILKKQNNSSLFKPNFNIIEGDRKNDFEIDQIKKIKCVRLDTILSNIKHEFDFLKVDAQGGDLSVIKSLGKYIDDIVAIHLEAYSVSMYEDIPLFNEINQYLVEKGFYNTNALIRKNKSLLFDDYLYIKKDEIKIEKKELIKRLYNIL
jgi:FkbM family methyltransferase